MFVSAGEAGDAKKVQTSVAAARKVFRIFRVSYLCFTVHTADHALLMLKSSLLCLPYLHDVSQVYLPVLPCLQQKSASDILCCSQPLEAASPVLLNPALNPKKPLIIELINKVRMPAECKLQHAQCCNKDTLRTICACLQLKSVLMAIYFAGDHVVWASQAGIYTDEEGTEKYVPIYAWS